MYLSSSLLDFSSAVSNFLFYMSAKFKFYFIFHLIIHFIYFTSYHFTYILLPFKLYTCPLLLTLRNALFIEIWKLLISCSLSDQLQHLKYLLVSCFCWLSLTWPYFFTHFMGFHYEFVVLRTWAVVILWRLDMTVFLWRTFFVASTSYLIIIANLGPLENLCGPHR